MRRDSPPACRIHIVGKGDEAMNENKNFDMDSPALMKMKVQNWIVTRKKTQIIFFVKNVNLLFIKEIYYL